mgnify:CR=1 FL=1
MILTDNETRIDRLNNLAVAKTIVSIIKESKESVSIGVHGDWGAGKSSILAMVEDELELTANSEDSENKDVTLEYVITRFNSWQYQGFEDAKIALMSAIVSQLEKKAEQYCEKHKIENGISEIKSIGKRLWKNLDKLSIAKSIGKIGVSVATGTAPLALIDGVISVIKDTVTDHNKADEIIETIGNLIKVPAEEASGYKEMEEFRNNFTALFDKAHVRKLVVLIDDLDRCLPKVAIETLEAVRMFLTLDNTTFIIAADDAMIRYSVKEYFPRVLEQEHNNLDSISKFDYNRFSDKYLEKLIQIPLHIPRIGIAEAQLYIMLLLIESALGEVAELKTLGDVVINKLHKPWALEQLSTEEIKRALDKKYDSVFENIKIAKSIDKILAEHTNGNPRNIKRFINMLLLRTEIARNRGFEPDELKMAVLAKMMLAEQYNNDFYKALAGELDENGHCKALETQPEQESNEVVISNKSIETLNDAKEGNAKKAKSTGEDKKIGTLEKVKTMEPTAVRQESFKVFLEQDDVKTWMQIDPSLASVDLRPYFFACTEKIDFFFSSPEERLRELVSVIRAGKFNTGRKKAEIQGLDTSDAKRLLKIVSQDVFTSNLSENQTPKSIEGIRCVVEFRSELQTDLVEFLLTLPLDKLGIWATGGWDSCIPKTSEARGLLKQFFKGIEENNSNKLIIEAAKSAQR